MRTRSTLVVAANVGTGVNPHVDGDFDGHGFIDPWDDAAFFLCASGPGQTNPSVGCSVFGFDTNGGVERQEARTFQYRYNRQGSVVTGGVIFHTLPCNCQAEWAE